MRWRKIMNWEERREREGKGALYAAFRGVRSKEHIEERERGGKERKRVGCKKFPQCELYSD